MSEQEALLHTKELQSIYPLLASGKVRDLYELDSSTLLFVATDRISAFDVNLQNGIPTKGQLLTLLSTHWFNLFRSQIPELLTHFKSLDLPSTLRKESALAANFNERCMQVRRLKVLPIESIVRGYITGSAWSEYKKNGTIHGLPAPKGLQESQKLEHPMWTPSTKAEPGEKDENISPERAAEIIGPSLARQVQTLSLQIYTLARDYAAERGIIIADTKFEFGVDQGINGEEVVVLVDEVLTPDSSRFWPASKYMLGQSQESFDKQYLRDWLVNSGLKGKEGVAMPEDVVKRTFEGYKEAFERLVGKKWGDVLQTGLP